MRAINRIRTYLGESWSAVLSIFVATWPGIISNLISDLLSIWFNIEKSPGVFIVLFLASTTFILSTITSMNRRKARRFGFERTDPSVLRTQVLHQSSLFSLAYFLTGICQGLISWPITWENIIYFLATFVPILEGSVSQESINNISNEAVNSYYKIMEHINRLLQYGSRVTQSMIENRVRQEGTVKMSREALSNYARMLMVAYYKMHATTEGGVVLDDFRHQDKWQLVKKESLEWMYREEGMPMRLDTSV